MPNTITLAKNYTSLLDEVYRTASVTADLTSDSAMSRAGANANEIIYPQISVSGLGDYDRNSGYTTGAVDLKWKTAAFNYDRGTKISVDVMDNEESRNIAFSMAGATLIREKVAPEADAFTFATLSALENISKTTGTIADASQFLDALLTAWSKMDEDEVPQENRILYATATLLNSVMALDTTKSREILAKFTVKKVVPQARFYTAIDLLDGKSGGEEAGHYKKADTGQEINFMIVHKPAIIKFDKHTVSNIISASSNPDADADIVKYRKYGIVDGYANKRAGIYLNSKA
nr:MAG TPA: Major capsid protein [Caudoviricetes sp.]